MRYQSSRKYPITQMKKENQAGNRQERIMDLSVGAAAGILALVFVEGLFWGYIGCRSMSRR